MATSEQVERIFERMEKRRPDNFLKKADETQAGIGAVLRLLSESDETVTAGKISETLGISTARVAVLLKKMAAKELITKSPSAEDGRVTVVSLTDHGQEVIARIKTELYTQTARIIDAVGEERLLEFFTIADEICAAVEEPHFEF